MNDFSSRYKPHAGVMGWPIDHSLSPRLHGFWLRQLGMEGVYKKCAVPPEKLGEALKALPSQGWRGVNLTIPHKEKAMSFMDRLDPLALRVGAVNTVVVADDGMLEGYNTDVFGFWENVRSAGFNLVDKPVTLVGAGGAARAAAVALIEKGVSSLRIINRTLARAEKMVTEIGDARVHFELFSFEERHKALCDSCLLVNATSLGLTEKFDFDFSNLPNDAWVTDMVYTPPLTTFLKKAQEHGHRVVDGLGMLLHQGCPAFEAFFGMRPVVTDELRIEILRGE